MTTTEQPISALGLALIALAGTTAGFLAASVPTSSATVDVGPIPPGEARSLDPAPEQVALSAVDGGPAQLLVFDEEARYLRTLSLEPGQERTSVALPDEAAIVLVPTVSDAVGLDLPTSSSANVSSVPTREAQRTVTTADGGTVDEDATFTIPNRPASVGLRIDGEAAGLDVRVRTSEGTVLRAANASANATSEGARLDAGNLTNGTYRVSAHADRLDGRIRLVTRTLAGDEQLQTLEAPDPELSRMGALVARVQEGQVWQIPTTEAESLTLAIERGAWADVRVYGPEDRILRRVEVGQDGPSWRWGSNTSEGPAYDAVRLDVREGTYTVYADRIQADSDRVVYALLPGQPDAQPGRPVEIASRTVEIPYPSTSSPTNEQTLRYAGGLVDVRVAGGQGPAVDRRVLVESPRGIVLDRHDQASAEGARVLTDSVKHVERFGAGPLDVTVEAEAATGTVEIALEHYVP